MPRRIQRLAAARTIHRDAYRLGALTGWLHRDRERDGECRGVAVIDVPIPRQTRDIIVVAKLVGTGLALEMEFVREDPLKGVAGRCLMVCVSHPMASFAALAVDPSNRGARPLPHGSGTSVLRGFRTSLHSGSSRPLTRPERDGQSGACERTPSPVRPLRQEVDGLRNMLQYAQQ